MNMTEEHKRIRELFQEQVSKDYCCNLEQLNSTDNEYTVRELKEKGCKHIKFMAIIGAPEGISRVAEAHPDVDIYVSTVDRCLNENGYILPGLGDAGDRLFGTK